MARSFNFRTMEPAPLETLSILRAKSGSQIDEQIYHFKDKADREVGLRFDLTVGMTRFATGRKDLKPPIKLASYGGVWRYDEPQHARYRWFHQWDVEIFGDPGVDADAEVMDLTCRLFKRLGLAEVTLEIGDRRVVEEFITRTLKVESPEKREEMMRALDKVSKKTEDELLAEYEAKGVAPASMKELLAFGRAKSSPDDLLKRLAEYRLESASGLGELRDSLKARGIPNVEFNLSIVRGIDYYTGIVFEVVDNKRPDLGSLCGGGRYDALPKIFGRPDLAATGAAGGVERIASSLSKSDPRVLTSVFVAYTEPALVGRAISILSSLREGGIRSELGARGKGLSKQLEDADAMDFTHAVIVGKREVETGSLTLKDLRERKERKIPAGSLLSELSPS